MSFEEYNKAKRKTYLESYEQTGDEVYEKVAERMKTMMLAETDPEKQALILYMAKSYLSMSCFELADSLIRFIYCLMAIPLETPELLCLFNIACRLRHKDDDHDSSKDSTPTPKAHLWN